jgi:ABC-type multidrug transport system fused ATPase/permease subunit
MSTFGKLWRLLRPAQRRKFVWLQLLSLLMAGSTVIGLASILPFFSMLVDPGVVDRNAFLGWLHHQFSPGDSRHFLTLLGVAFGAALVIGNAINLAGSLAMCRFAYAIGDDLRIALYDEYLNRSYGARLATPAPPCPTTFCMRPIA